MSRDPTQGEMKGRDLDSGRVRTKRDRGRDNHPSGKQNGRPPQRGRYEGLKLRERRACVDYFASRWGRRIGDFHRDDTDRGIPETRGERRLPREGGLTQFGDHRSCP